MSKTKRRRSVVYLAGDGVPADRDLPSLVREYFAALDAKAKFMVDDTDGYDHSQFEPTLARLDNAKKALRGAVSR